MRRARDEERGTELLCLSERALLLAPPLVGQPGSSPNPILLDFYEGFLTQACLFKSWINHD